MHFHQNMKRRGKKWFPQLSKQSKEAFRQLFVPYSFFLVSLSFFFFLPLIPPSDCLCRLSGAPIQLLQLRWLVGLDQNPASCCCCCCCCCCCPLYCLQGVATMIFSRKRNNARPPVSFPFFLGRPKKRG